MKSNRKQVIASGSSIVLWTACLCFWLLLIACSGFWPQSVAFVCFSLLSYAFTCLFLLQFAQSNGAEATKCDRKRPLTTVGSLSNWKPLKALKSNHKQLKASKRSILLQAAFIWFWFLIVASGSFSVLSVAFVCLSLLWVAFSCIFLLLFAQPNGSRCNLKQSKAASNNWRQLK